MYKIYRINFENIDFLLKINQQKYQKSGDNELKSIVFDNKNQV